MFYELSRITLRQRAFLGFLSLSSSNSAMKPAVNRGVFAPVGHQFHVLVQNFILCIKQKKSCRHEDIFEIAKEDVLFKK
ncbi:unnamed protein product [Coffea canephora]|uniref:DH200=94 genomic scaffold, scaffold_2935 n=1 Tax=Coffea canephora TaxID=49390 RepID=A0A068VKC9_COFCA|nr:unnamed protein product [Coffea canephora]